MNIIDDYTGFEVNNYLSEFYSGDDPGDENRFLLEFYHRFFGGIVVASKILDLGGGPCLYQDISASRRASEIVFSEYLETNRRAIRAWLDRSQEAFDWKTYFREVARMENADAASVEERLRRAITRVIPCDLTKDDVLENSAGERFDIIISAFCIEGITGDFHAFCKFLPRIMSLLLPGGHFIGSVVRNCRSCKVCGIDFVVTPLDEASLEKSLGDAGFRCIRIETKLADATHGYDAIMVFEAESPST